MVISRQPRRHCSFLVRCLKRWKAQCCALLLDRLQKAREQFECAVLPTGRPKRRMACAQPLNKEQWRERRRRCIRNSLSLDSVHVIKKL
eukprot:scaffold117380_cov32-Tisochrysis_lutea.AAC.1